LKNLRAAKQSGLHDAAEYGGESGSGNQENTAISRAATANRKKSTMFGIAFCTLLFALCVPAQQPPKQVHRLGYLSAWNAATESSRVEGLRRALRKLGYVPSQNIAIEYRYADGKREQYREFAAELVRLKVDLIVLSGGLIPIEAAKSATQTIPIIMTGVGADPVKTGLVESLARPGGNVNGITSFEMDLSGKRLELLKEAAPTLSRVAVLYDPAVPAGRQLIDDLPVAARLLGLSIQPLQIRAAQELESVFAAATKERAEGLYASGSLVIHANGKRIADFALKNRLPSMHRSEKS
jgi:ABC-type uncharacterized transport system substrate-binding protein